MLLYSLSEEILPLVVGCDTSRDLWQVLEKSLNSPSNTRILGLHRNLNELDQKDESVSVYLQRAKTISDELFAAGRPISIEDFNVYVFRGLKPDFKDLVTTLSVRTEPISFSELHSLLLGHEPAAYHTSHSSDTFPEDFQWFPDTGATHHASPDLHSLTTAQPYECHDQLHVGDGKGLQISHIGKSLIHTSSCSPLYASCSPCSFSFQVTRATLLRGPSKNGLDCLNDVHPSSLSSSPTVLSAVHTTADGWHRRLGHPHARVLHQIIFENKLPCISSKLQTLCSLCQLGKASRSTLSVTHSRSSHFLDLIHSDVWGPALISSLNGFRYFVLFHAIS
ncbi:hypothetical protein RJ640_005035 [Escallonia rubra]|uniref:GAG-pre-integrase domain-containing protein n=1 Tax=Escallonia rubra TaxID=112253 RepID=A0AA88U620_9ASTE|nr:hypothetical protein RJ640_005035 [Escallonia rubra]